MTQKRYIRDYYGDKVTKNTSIKFYCECSDNKLITQKLSDASTVYLLKSPESIWSRIHVTHSYIYVDSLPFALKMTKMKKGKQTYPRVSRMVTNRTISSAWMREWSSMHRLITFLYAASTLTIQSRPTPASVCVRMCVSVRVHVCVRACVSIISVCVVSCACVCPRERVWNWPRECLMKLWKIIIMLILLVG